MLRQRDLDYFRVRGSIENPRFWPRFGGMPNFNDAIVVDIGCAHGSLCVNIAQAGAKRVIGIDIFQEVIDFANENIRQNYPELLGIVEFRCIQLENLAVSDIDYFVSKDCFEHIIGVEKVLYEAKKRLKIGGRILCGFGPLWNSGWGDHGRVKVPVYWLHAFIPKKLLIRWRNLFFKEKVSCLEDLGLNGLTFSDYRRMFHECGMKIVQFDVNRSWRRVMCIFNILRKLPLCEEIFSFNIYCIMEKVDDN